MLVRNCPKFSAIQIIKTSILENKYAAKTTTDTAVILTSVKFPGSSSVLISRQTIGCKYDTSQAIGVVYEYFIVKCKCMAARTFVLSLFRSSCR